MDNGLGDTQVQDRGAGKRSDGGLGTFEHLRLFKGGPQGGAGVAVGPERIGTEMVKVTGMSKARQVRWFLAAEDVREHPVAGHQVIDQRPNVPVRTRGRVRPLAGFDRSYHLTCRLERDSKTAHRRCGARYRCVTSHEWQRTRRYGSGEWAKGSFAMLHGWTSALRAI